MDTIITIGRHYGSGGKEIGKRLAEELGIPFYDDEIVKMVAESDDIHPDTVKNAEEKVANSLLYSLMTGGGLRGVSEAMQSQMPINDKVFIGQSKAIKALAKKGPCVFVGRCADYVLEDENIFKVFVYSDMKSKIARISEIYKIDNQKAKEKITKTEKSRKTYYNYYTDKVWGDMAGYDLCINTGKTGIDGAVRIIKSSLEEN